VRRNVFQWQRLAGGKQPDDLRWRVASLANIRGSRVFARIRRSGAPGERRVVGDQARECVWIEILKQASDAWPGLSRKRKRSASVIARPPGDWRERSAWVVPRQGIGLRAWPCGAYRNGLWMTPADFANLYIRLSGLGDRTKLERAFDDFR